MQYYKASNVMVIIRRHNSRSNCMGSNSGATPVFKSMFSRGVNWKENVPVFTQVIKTCRRNRMQNPTSVNQGAIVVPQKDDTFSQ
jgi:hypothetical protein